MSANSCMSTERGSASIDTVSADAKWEMSEFVILLGWAENVGCPDDDGGQPQERRHVPAGFVLPPGCD